MNDSHHDQGVKMFKLVYHPADADDDPASGHAVTSRDLDPRLNSYKMDNLTSDTRYRVCVHAIQQGNAELATSSGASQVSPSSSSPRNRRCAEARTLPLGGVPRPVNAKK